MSRSIDLNYEPFLSPLAFTQSKPVRDVHFRSLYMMRIQDDQLNRPDQCFVCQPLWLYPKMIPLPAVPQY